jgi:hypothetical protein
VPVVDGVQPPEVIEVPIQVGRAFVIRYNGYTDAFVFNDEGDKTVETGAFDTNFRYSWARLRQGENIPDEFVLIDGSELKIGEYEIVNTQVPFASARRLGNELYIKTDSSRITASLGPAERRQGDRR